MKKFKSNDGMKKEKKKDLYLIVKVYDGKHAVDSDRYLERQFKHKKKVQKSKTANLRVKGKRRKKTHSEREGRHSIYTGSFFRLGVYGSGRKGSTLEIIYLYERLEIKPGQSICISVEEWNGRPESRMFTKRMFYRDEDQNWKPGRKSGFNYLDLEHLLKETRECKKLRKYIIKLLEEPFEEDK